MLDGNLSTSLPYLCCNMFVCREPLLHLIVPEDQYPDPFTGCRISLSMDVARRKENLAQGASWETLSWFAALIAMANHLNKFGFIAWFSDKVS